MRLRLAPVEYKVCATAQCGSEYEGGQCPTCKQPFDPSRMDKRLHDRLILVDTDPSIYEQVQRCRCTACKSLFDLTEADIVARAICADCDRPLFNKEQLQTIWKEARTLLQRARRLDRARRQLQVCPHCEFSIVVSWCPLTDCTARSAGTGGLPQNLTAVWVRTFHAAESVEELQGREWLGGQAVDDEWTEDEDETPITPEEGRHYGDPHE